MKQLVICRRIVVIFAYGCHVPFSRLRRSVPAPSYHSSRPRFVNGLLPWVRTVPHRRCSRCGTRATLDIASVEIVFLGEKRCCFDGRRCLALPFDNRNDRISTYLRTGLSGSCCAGMMIPSNRRCHRTRPKSEAHSKCGIHTLVHDMMVNN